MKNTVQLMCLTLALVFATSSFGYSVSGPSRIDIKKSSYGLYGSTATWDKYQGISNKALIGDASISSVYYSVRNPAGSWSREEERDIINCWDTNTRAGCRGAGYTHKFRHLGSHTVRAQLIIYGSHGNNSGVLVYNWAPTKHMKVIWTR